MGAIGGLIFLAVIYAVFSAVSTGGPAGAYDKLVARGVPARGILLQVSPLATRAVGSSRLRPFERRAMVIDVEIAGQPPYEISVTPLVPLNLGPDVLPGATLELRVDRRNPGNIAIVGPGAFLAAQSLRQVGPS